jgi:hypothetical protein
VILHRPCSGAAPNRRAAFVACPRGRRDWNALPQAAPMVTQDSTSTSPAPQMSPAELSALAKRLRNRAESMSRCPRFLATTSNGTPFITAWLAQVWRSW